MNIGLPELLVALFMLVPGFVATSIHRAFSPKRFSSDLHWTVASLLIALALNGFLLLPFLFVGKAVSLDSPLSGVASSLVSIPVGLALTYIVLLYLSSVVLGFALGFFPALSLRRLLNRAGLISFAEHPSVWDRILGIRRSADRPVTWLRFKSDDGRIILGHLRHCSEHIDKEKPFEIYLLSPHEWNGSHWKPVDASHPDLRLDGMYARLSPTQVVEFFFTGEGWKP